jgi:aspartyl-tRNA(Asn)/glutamyl-tRNA(Gln) amidotransferase subunit A
VSIPAGFTSGGLPVGIQLMAGRLRDDRAVEAGAAYAAYAPALFRRPEVDPAQAKPIPDRLPSPGMVMR